MSSKFSVPLGPLTTAPTSTWRPPVDPGGGREPEGAGGRVELGDVHRRGEGLGPRRTGAGLQLASQLGDQVARGHLEPGSRPAAPQRPDQVGVGQGAGVVEVERLAVPAAQVGAGPVGGGPQPARRPPVEAAPHQQHLRRRVGGRVGELDEVAGVEPAALDVHRAADRPERRRRHVAPVALEHRLGVHRGPPVGQVGGPAVEPRRDAGAVALHLEEADGVVDQRPEQGPAGRDPEPRQGGQAADHDPVAARPAQGAEVDGVDGPVAAVPAAGPVAARAATTSAARARNPERGRSPIAPPMIRKPS